MAGPDNHLAMAPIALQVPVLVALLGVKKENTAQMEYDLGGFGQVTALEERRRDALPDLPPSDLLNVALQKYRYSSPY